MNDDTMVKQKGGKVVVSLKTHEEWNEEIRQVFIATKK